MTARPILPLVFPEMQGTFLPLLGGEGRGEDGRETFFKWSARRRMGKTAASGGVNRAAKISLGWTNGAEWR